MSVRDALGATDTGTVELSSSAIGVRARSLPSRAGLIGITGMVATTLLVAVAAPNTDSLLPETVRPIPGSLAGPFRNAGLSLGTGSLIVVLALMFASYVMVVRAADRVPAGIVLTAIAAVYAFVLLAPPLLSTDVFNYQFYGRMVALYGANPYTAGPHALALDPLYQYLPSKWSYIPTAYGPLFTGLSSLLAPLSIAANVFAYKAIAACSGLATVVLVWHSARLRGIDPVKPVALVGLNPLVVVYGVGGGHNDLLMLLGVVAGIYLVLRGRQRSGGAIMVLAAAVKITAVLPLAFAFASGGGRRSRARGRDVLIGAGVATAVIAGLSFAWLGTGPLHLPATLAKAQSEGDWSSIPGFISTRLGLGDIGHIAGIVLFVAFVGVFCWLLRRVWRGELDWLDAAGWTAAALLLTASSLLPWYVAWLMPLAALATDRRLTRVAIAGSGVVLAIQMIGYIPHGTSVLGL